ncbi:hypothetical protein BKI52_38700 [marine bacterium AO1-C]|nr:hypothetical protein BKI52_38700 [marine bacterium AO1-C]
MNVPEIKSVETLLIAYKNGQRHFKNWDFGEDESVAGIDLSGAIFESCFMFLDFNNANLSNVQFLSCNIKTADFSGANLTNATIKDCCVEGTIYTDAITDNIIFENNGYYGINLIQKDFNLLIDVSSKT